MNTRPLLAPIKDRLTPEELQDEMNTAGVPLTVIPAGTDTDAPADTPARLRRRVDPDEQPTPRDKLQKVAAMLPPEVVRALKARSAEKRCSVNFLILQALKRDGWPVRSADLIDDGRKSNAKRKKIK
jgi:hypothetical protein